MVGSKTSTRRLPSALARYIATSALRRTSSDRLRRARTALMPALQPTTTSVPWSAERELERGDDPLGHRQGVLRRSSRPPGRSGELVAAEPGEQVVRPELLADPLGDGDEQVGRRRRGPACR